ncbi:MAG TPA: YlxR family protein [Firmicutes bacterium]|nr:YlxR family protein [Candidatus Fermentithermobacillaceae bacterium]
MPRRLPQRTCLGCQTIRPKREMIRIVRTPEGNLVVDDTGKKSGRGAYVCPNLDCLEALRKGKRLERALEVPPPPSLFEELRERILTISDNRR